MRCMPRSDNVGAMCRRGGSHDARMSSTGEVDVAAGEEASLVVANTPAALIQYDPFDLGSDVLAGLDYTVTITGATA